ncbi:hypothetical protein BGZ96_000817 [Linnemannia gamsii]|uniref:Uncharacterized protein n=1 Tax=Linnemannia gamsii TaxID=64522 RepID=A0ABQ7KCM1_9FUNG|nr:hypothetical protein BGZ96_000817 [Linnemannia gamsii]
MARTNPPPALSIKTLFTPSTFVCLLALSACTPTSALPISTPHSSSTTATASSISSDSKDSANANAINARSIESTAADSSSSSTPFRTVSRPITIHVDLTPAGSSSDSASPYERLIRHTEQQEQLFRNRETEALARLAQEQDELEMAEQDRDQQLDNEEEEQLAQDPETVRRRQEESMGLWMTDAELDAASISSNKVVVAAVPAAADVSPIQVEEVEPQEAIAVAESEEGVKSSNAAATFDLYADDFKEVLASSSAAVVVKVGRRQNLRRLAPEFTEEEMLQWPIINLAQFEDRQDEVQDEYEEE